ncbi:site-specific integrase [uncultured Shewanella sp.]|uniref:tyrosine-type recombinase/integrase n=1 Tax=uncultured Shewanella sp. TaxID=173975 RepID=UPI002635F504|nr:site-specific integrase [uncultured Shewanella sp.]
MKPVTSMLMAESKLDMLLSPKQAKAVIKENSVKSIEVHGRRARAIIRCKSVGSKVVKVPLSNPLTFLGIMASKKIIEDLKTKTIKELETLKSYKKSRVSDVNIETLVEQKRNRSEKTLAESTKKGYTTCYNHIIKDFGSQKANQITRDDIFDWCDSCDHLSQKSLKERLRLLDGVFKEAVLSKAIGEKPFDYEELIRSYCCDVVLDKRVPHFIKPELQKVKEATGDNDLMALYMLLHCYTGLRYSELLALAWEDIDFENNQIIVQRALVTKQYKSIKNRGETKRIVTLAEPAKVVLLKLKSLTCHLPAMEVEVRGADRIKRIQSLHFVVTNPLTRSRENIYHHYRKLFYKKLTELGIKIQGPNQCRHTFAIMLINNGVSLEDVSAELGHCNTRTTKNYYIGAMARNKPTPKKVAEMSKALSITPSKDAVEPNFSYSLPQVALDSCDIECSGHWMVTNRLSSSNHAYQ